MLEVWAQEYMKALTPHYHHIRFVTIGLLTLIAAFLSLTYISRVAHAESAEPSSEHIITVHDDVIDKGFMTQKSTLREALTEAKITIDPKDRTEPGLDEKLVARSYQVNVYRARAVVVRDGARETKVITSYRTGKQIAKDAGISLHDEDKTTITTATDLASTGAPEILTISRATTVNFVFYGKTLQVYTFAKTIGQLLAEKRITPAENDIVSPVATTPITDGMAVRLWREGKQTLTRDEDIVFTTQKVQDANQNIGYSETRTPGVSGKRTVTYEVLIQDGVEVSRKEISSVTTMEPIQQVEVVGVKGMYTTPTENETITWNFLISHGLSREQTAGIMGNLKQEHGFNTTGDGLAQWTGGRQARLRSMYPETYMTIQSQLDFLWFELTGSYAGVLSSLKSQTTAEGATIVFQNQFERCGVCVQDRRIQYAYNILASH